MNATSDWLRRDYRNVIHCKDALLVEQQSLPARQFLLRFQAPDIAAQARPGQFVHLQCDPQLPMRRPFSIMLTDPHAGTLDILYKAVGHGTQMLSGQKAGAKLSMLGPIGRPFHVDANRPALLLGGGIGIPPMVFIAQDLKQNKNLQALAVLGSEVPFPFQAVPSRYLLQALPRASIAAMPLLEDWGIPTRLTSLQGYPGCYEGYVTDLAAIWLESLEPETRAEVIVYACGPHAMLHAAARLAQHHGLTAQLSLEEYMACAVGGCAGCTVRVRTHNGPAMKRVCVDGPVFLAEDVEWAQ